MPDAVRPALASSRVAAVLLQYLRRETPAIWSLSDSPIGVPFGIVGTDGSSLGYLCLITEDQVGRYRRIGAAVAQALPALLEAEGKTFAVSSSAAASGLGIDAPDSRLSAYFQPIVALRTGEVVGVEALARLQTLDGVLSPEAFLESYRSGPEMLGMFDRILESTLTFVGEQRHRLPHLTGSVNLELGAIPDHGLADLVARHLEATRVPGDALMIELNERLPYQLSADARRELAAVAELGVQLLIDDFPSSLRALDQLQGVAVEGAKLDRKFVKHLTAGDHAVAEVRAVLAQAAELGIEVIAEGVETERQRDLLVAVGCRFGQGFAFAVPQPGSSLAGVLDAPLVANS